MKKVLLYIPIVLSFVVLGAHFLRYGSDLGVVGAALLMGLLFVRQPWVARLMQVALVLGAIMWVSGFSHEGKRIGPGSRPSPGAGNI